MAKKPPRKRTTKPVNNAKTAPSESAQQRAQSLGTLGSGAPAGAMMAPTPTPSDSVSNEAHAALALEADLANGEPPLGAALFSRQGPFAPPEPDDVESSDDGLLDSWHACFGADESDSSIESLGDQNVAALVLGKDDRGRVPDTTQFPYRCICSLIITAANGSRWVGSGWLVGQRLIATAGHNVFMHKQGGWSRRIEIIPGRNGAARPFGTFFSSKFQSTRGWTVEKRPEFDYAGIVLEEPIGAKLGYFGYKNLDVPELKRSIANVVGYPGDKVGGLKGTLWGQSQRLRKITTNTLIYSIDTAGGQSGCPVFRADQDDFYGIGIHNYGDRSGNSATRITKDVFENLERWQT